MHTFIPGIGDPPPASNPEHTAAIRRWTREILRLDDDAIITVSDARCVDPGCPLVETVVTIFDATGTRTWAFTRPAMSVTKMMIQQTLATPPRGAQKSKPNSSRSNE